MEKILTNYHVGWLTFNLGSWKLSASFLRDTPNELLNACLKYFDTKEPQLVVLDQEDEGRSFVMIDWYVSIIKSDLRYSANYDYEIENFAKALCKNIQEDMDQIINDFYCELCDNQKKMKKQLNKKCNKLLKIIDEVNNGNL